MLQTEQKEYKSLLASRKLIVILLLLLTIIPYFSFISIIAFKPSIFGQLIDGYSLSIGVALGFILILHIFFITFLYVFFANWKIEPMVNKLKN